MHQAAKRAGVAVCSGRERRQPGARQRPVADQPAQPGCCGGCWSGTPRPVGSRPLDHQKRRQLGSRRCRADAGHVLTFVSGIQLCLQLCLQVMGWRPSTARSCWSVWYPPDHQVGDWCPCSPAGAASQPLVPGSARTRPTRQWTDPTAAAPRWSAARGGLSNSSLEDRTTGGMQDCSGRHVPPIRWAVGPAPSRVGVTGFLSISGGVDRAGRR
jgi:hypothetical protein